MPSLRPITAFAVKFLVIYAVLGASWPVCGHAYAFFLRESGEVLLGAFGAHKNVRMRAAAPPDGINDTVLLIGVRGPEHGIKITISSWLIGFQPTSLLLALVVATPVSARRRSRALFAGLLIVHTFVLARLVTFVIPMPIVLPDTLWAKALRWSIFDFIHGHGVSCVVPVLIWLAVTMRQEDIRRLVASPRFSTAHGARAQSISR